jgi:hypothetical protein
MDFCLHYMYDKHVEYFLFSENVHCSKMLMKSYQFKVKRPHIHELKLPQQSDYEEYHLLRYDGCHVVC